MKTIKLLTSLLLGTMLFAGCGGDDDSDSESGNYFKINGKTYELKVGYLQNWGMDADYYDGYNVDLLLVSDGITFDAENEEFSGTGDGIYFEMYSSMSNQLPAGSYTYSSTEPNSTSTFDYGEYYVDFNTSTYDYTSYGFFNSGTITVSKSGSTYEISFTCTSSEGQSCTGYFKGQLTVLNFELVGKANQPAKEMSLKFKPAFRDF